MRFLRVCEMRRVHLRNDYDSSLRFSENKGFHSCFFTLDCLTKRQLKEEMKFALTK